MNLQSIVLLVLLAGAFLLAVKKSKDTACSGSCPNCPHRQECRKKEKRSSFKNSEQ